MGRMQKRTGTDVEDAENTQSIPEVTGRHERHPHRELESGIIRDGTQYTGPI